MPSVSVHAFVRMLLVSCILSLSSTLARAQDAPETPPAAPPPKPQYSLPWSLRPAIAPTVLRSDSTFASAETSNTFVSTLLGGYKFIPNLGAYAKMAFTHHNPEQGESGNVFSNPLLFGLFTPELAKGIRLPVMLGFTLPIGGGGGDSPDLPNRAAPGAAIPTRGAMENALYATNFATITEGIGIAYIRHGLTLQAEVTLLQLIRTRGDAVEKDGFRHNSTYGLHAGYAILPKLYASVEMRYQRWLTDAQPVVAAAANRDTLTVGGGVRVTVPAGPVTLRPGVAYFAPLDDPMQAAKIHTFTLDVPILF